MLDLKELINTLDLTNKSFLYLGVSCGGAISYSFSERKILHVYQNQYTVDLKKYNEVEKIMEFLYAETNSNKM